MSAGYERYAISWIPPLSEQLADFGLDWTGWCPERGEKFPRRASPADGLDLPPLTRETCRQGFHGVLKPAFALRDPHVIWQVERMLQTLADEAREVRVHGLEVGVVDGRVALVPAPENDALARLVRRVRRAMIPFDGAPDAGDADTGEGEPACAGVRIAPADSFHLPLTDRLPLPTACRIATRIRPLVETVTAHGFTISDLALVADPGDGLRLCVLQRYPLADRLVGGSDTFACCGPRTLVRPERHRAPERMGGRIAAPV